MCVSHTYSVWAAAVYGCTLCMLPVVGLVYRRYGPAKKKHLSGSLGKPEILIGASPSNILEHR